MADEGMYRWIYFTDTGGQRRVLRRWLDDDANVTSSDAFTFPAPPTGYARYGASLIGDKLICADWNRTTGHLKLTLVELPSGGETPLWQRMVGTSYITLFQPYAGPMMYSLQSDASTLLLVVENLLFVVDLNRWVVIGECFTSIGVASPYGRGPALAIGEAGAYVVTLIVGGRGTPGFNDADAFSVYGPFDPRAVVAGSTSTIIITNEAPLAGSFWIEIDPYNHWGLDGMLGVIGRFADDTILRGSFAGYAGGVISRVVAGVGRTFNHGHGWSGQPVMQPMAFVDVTPEDRPALYAAYATAIGTPTQFAAGAAGVYLSADLDWSAEIAAAGYSYLDSDAYNPYVAGSGHYTPPPGGAVVVPPFWTNRVRSDERDAGSSGGGGVVDPTEPPADALGPFTLTMVAGNGNGGAYNGFAVDLGGPFGSLTPNVIDLGGGATLTLDTLYSVVARLSVSALSPFTAIYLSCSLGRFYLPDTYGEGWAEAYMPVGFVEGETYAIELYIVP